MPKVHHTVGGLSINTKVHVISSQTAMPIPNLYVAGKITGGVYGASRLGSDN
ncbi:FAD-binding protein [Campylobacter concisus]